MAGFFFGVGIWFGLKGLEVGLQIGLVWMGFESKLWFDGGKWELHGEVALFIMSSPSIAWRSGPASKTVVSRCHRTWSHRHQANMEARGHDFSLCARFLVRAGSTRFDVRGMVWRRRQCG